MPPIPMPPASTSSPTCGAATTSATAVSSPYAPFRAADWGTATPTGSRPIRPTPMATTGWVCWVQGDLFSPGASGGSV